MACTTPTLIQLTHAIDRVVPPIDRNAHPRGRAMPPIISSSKGASLTSALPPNASVVWAAGRPSHPPNTRGVCVVLNLCACPSGACIHETHSIQADGAGRLVKIDLLSTEPPPLSNQWAKVVGNVWRHSRSVNAEDDDRQGAFHSLHFGRPEAD